MSFMLVEVIPRWGVREPFSAFSHLLGAVLGLAALAMLIWRARQRGMSTGGVLALVVYSISMAVGFTASAVFHGKMVSYEELVFFKKLDHAAIFVMIAGTGTALYGALNSRWAGPVIGVLWVVCMGSLVVKMVVWPMPLSVTALMYVTVGWCTLLGLFAIVRAVGWERVRPLFVGAAVLTVGAAVFALRWPVLWPGVIEGHEVFHVLVLAGAGIHFWFIYDTCTLPGALSPAGG